MKVSCITFTIPHDDRPSHLDMLLECFRYSGNVGHDDVGDGHKITLIPPRYVGKVQTAVWAAMNVARLASFGITADVVIKDIG
jgi:hypothetical protein